MARPRKPSSLYVRDDGQCYLNRNALADLKESAELRGIYKVRFIGFDPKPNYVELWVATDKNEYTVALNISGKHKTIQFKSKTLARKVGPGYKDIKIL